MPTIVQCNSYHDRVDDAEYGTVNSYNDIVDAADYGKIQSLS